MAYYLEFKLDGLPKTTNAKRGFGHWAQYYRESVKWKKSLIPYFTSMKPSKPLKKARLTLTRYSSSQPDYDGLVSSFKHVIDALVDAGILENDKPQNIGRSTYTWEKAEKNKGYIRVLVEEIEGY